MPVPIPPSVALISGLMGEAGLLVSDFGNAARRALSASIREDKSVRTPSNALNSVDDPLAMADDPTAKADDRVSLAGASC
jgi:hypothetical protein